MMAKRKRLGEPTSIDQAAPEVKSYPLGLAPGGRPPIAQVAGDASALAAAQTLAAEIQTAQSEGRLVIEVALDAIDENHILRDRILLNDEDMSALMESIRSRGQQTAIEVVDLGQGRYGLISGLRRVTALRRLYAETHDPAFGVAKALIRSGASLSDIYVAMVEENEIRADLSFYERASLAVKAAQDGVFPTPKKAIKALFANTTPARRSKIATFVKLHEMYGASLRYPHEVPEKVGLALVKAGETNAELVSNINVSLENLGERTAAQERALLDMMLKPKSPELETITLRPGLEMTLKAGRMTLHGRAVTDDFVSQLKSYLALEP